MRRVTVAERLSLALYVVALVATLAVLSFAFAESGLAGDPIPTMRNIYGAPYAVITVYEVKPGMEAQFLDAMVLNGPYNKLLSGFANERILQPLPADEGENTTYSSIGRYYDLATANFIEKQRDPITRPFLARDPLRFEARLVEHWLGNWGWERGTKGGATRVEPFKNDEIFQKHLSSLSYFKAGYIGQVGALELFPKGTDLEQVRAELQGHPGLSGASVYAIGGDGRYACYREFFKSPERMEHHASRLPTSGDSVVGKQAGVVVQNYVSR